MAARIKYSPHEMAVMMGGVTCATIKLEIQSEEVQRALPLDCLDYHSATTSITVITQDRYKERITYP